MKRIAQSLTHPVVRASGPVERAFLNAAFDIFNQNDGYRTFNYDS